MLPVVAPSFRLPSLRRGLRSLASACRSSIASVLCLLSLWLGAATAAHAVTIATVTVSDVTTTSFTVVWQTSAPSTPGLDLFTNPEGTTPLGGQPRIEFTPLSLGNVEAGSTATTRAERRALASLVAGRNLASVRVSGLTPGATVYFRPRTFTAAGADNLTGTPPAITAVDLPDVTSFVADAQILAIDFAGNGATGLVAVLRGPAGTVPLTAVVGDGPNPDAAIFNLADLASSALGTNAGFTAPVQFTVSLLGNGAPGDTLTHTVTFQANTKPAGFGTATFVTGGVVPAYFSFDAIPAQDAGLGFTVTVRAMQGNGQPLVSYAGTVTLSGSSALAAGSGDTALFTAGVLADYPVRIDRGGEFTLTAAKGASTGNSNAFVVRDNTGAWRNANFSPSQLADPAQSGLAADLNNAGVPNLLRYAFATGVATPDRSRLPAVGVAAVGANNYLSITFRRLPYAADISYRVESSADATTWSLVQTVLPGLPELVTIQDTVAVGTARARFLRVNVVQQDTYAGYLNATAPADVRSDPSRYADAADPDNRGVPNLLRYAFGLNYASPDYSDLPQATTVSSGGQTYLAIAFNRLPAGADVRYLVQTSADMIAWTTIQTVLPGTPAAMVVQDTQAIGTSRARFIRVLVEPTTP